MPNTTNNVIKLSINLDFSALRFFLALFVYFVYNFIINKQIKYV